MALVVVGVVVVVNGGAWMGNRRDLQGRKGICLIVGILRFLLFIYSIWMVVNGVFNCMHFLPFKIFGIII